MIKVYRKMATIKAEQFDGSDEMVDKYHIEIDGAYGFRLETLEGWLGVNVNDWIVAGIDGEYWPIADDVFKQTYAELPVIPNYVAEYIDDMKSSYRDILDAMHYLSKPNEISYYIEDYPEKFARAWVDGYTVEADKLLTPNTPKQFK